jgi:ribosomal protein L35AE/L33A
MTSDVPDNFSPLARGRCGVAAVLTIAALALSALAPAGGAHANLVSVTIDLGTVSVLGDTVILTGSVGDSTVALRINGKPVTLSAGTFTAAVDLRDEQGLVVTLDGDDEDVTIRIPLAVLESEGGNALRLLEVAGISVEVPEGGFKVVDDGAPVVSGSVENPEALKSLTVGGRDVLRAVEPGGGAFSMTAPLGSTGVTVAATDPRGVSQATTFSTTSISTTMRTSAGTSVSAEGAQGVRIAKVRFVKNGLKKARRLGVVVIVKDRRGFLVRGAAVRVHGQPLRFMAGLGAVRAGFTNRVGRARFGFRVHPSAFEQRGRLTLTVRASTPWAAAKKAFKLRLPARTRA